MITIKDEPDCEPAHVVEDFAAGSTFKYKAGYYLVVAINVVPEHGDEEEIHLTAVDLGSGEEIGKYKQSRPCLYPVDLIMQVDHD